MALERAAGGREAMSQQFLWAIMTCTLACVTACGGEGELGDACGESGVEDGECVDGAICAKRGDAAEELECLEVCTDKAQCAATEDCNGVEGSSTKACRPK
jgi:hypothetical protein